MKKITIDCSDFESPRQLHAALSEAMNFPEWYGSNLDALHDLLSAISEDTELTLMRFSDLGSFRNGFRRVLQDSSEENPYLKVTIM